MKENASEWPLLAWNQPLKVWNRGFIETLSPVGFAPVFHFHFVLIFGPPAFFPLVPSPARRRTWEPNISYHGAACFWTPASMMGNGVLVLILDDDVGL